MLLAGFVVLLFSSFAFYQYKVICTTLVSPFDGNNQTSTQSSQTNERSDDSVEDNDQSSETSRTSLKSSSVSDLVFQDVTTHIIATSNINDSITKSSKTLKSECNKSTESSSDTLVMALSGCVILLLLTCMCGGFHLCRKIRRLRKALSKLSSLELSPRPSSTAPPRPPKSTQLSDSLDPPDGYEPMRPGVVPIYDQIKKSLGDKDVDYDEVYAHIEADQDLNGTRNWRNN